MVLSKIFLKKYKFVKYVNDKVKTEGRYEVPGRGAHCAFMNDTRMYIFGGYNMEGFCNSDLEVMELEQKEA